jgi:hypothetical protein
MDETTMTKYFTKNKDRKYKSCKISTFLLIQHKIKYNFHHLKKKIHHILLTWGMVGQDIVSTVYIHSLLV